jgi:hypothetical protein
MAASVYKWFVLPLFATVLLSAVPHPFHVTVEEMNHNAQDKTLEISCKIFTDDFEKTLAKNYNSKVDLTNPPNKAAMDSLVKRYIFAHLSLKVNGKPVNLVYVGFETDKEASYGYVEVDNVPAVSRVEITNSLMYDQFDDQVNIMHVIVGGKRQSTKLSYPDKEVTVSF